MTGSSPNTSHEDDDDRTTAGEKHQLRRKLPDVKRRKTEKQSSLDDYVETNDSQDSEANDSLSDAQKPDASAKKLEKSPDPQDKKERNNSNKTQNMPSNILEKGIVYFFIRGRVNIDEPEGVEDVARTYMILRPLAKDAQLGKGPLDDCGNSRLLALPKKVLPQSGRDRFMAFVEKSGASFDELKGEFLASSEYETKTVGTRHSPAATPIGEGVYMITTTGRETHFVYLKTLPQKLGEVQEELGLKDQGSFIISSKNPKYPGPANARLPQAPDYPKEIQDEFGKLRWLPSKPEHFDYVNSQILLIGESTGIDNAVEPQEEDKRKKDPAEVLENLEHEDLERMTHLGKDQSAAIFTDLHAQAKDYPKLLTSF